MKEKLDTIYKNPFPVTAVANFYNNIQNNMIVETKAIKEIKNIVEEWISHNKDGFTIAVQGEYGTGKTQLAIEMQKYINECDKNKYHFICLDSPSSSFLEMYKNRFLNELTKSQVLERLEACYYEIIVNDLKHDEIYKTFLKTNKNIKSIKLIERFGLAKSRYDFMFEKKLKKVTKNTKFVPALLLLLETRFEKEVWNWFNGSEPTDAMRERGVNFSIDDDTVALDSIGIFAFLFGQQEHRFVLFIDEMEKIISNTEKTKRDSFEALKKLIEIVKLTKSMLILCGLPDYYIALPRDIQQRIAYQIKTEKITLLEIEEYVSNANNEFNNKKALIPFSKKNLKDILDISNGNIRTIIRLLYHSGNWYIEYHSKINEKALCEILTSAYGTFDLTGIRKALAQIFISKGWLYEERKINEKSIIDFWLPSILTKNNSLENGIEIYLIQNLLSAEEYKQLEEKICNSTTNCKMFIIEGFINEHYYKCLSEKFKYVFRYRMQEFSDLFIPSIEKEKVKCENSIKQNDFSVINEKIEQLSRIVNRAISEINENTIGKQEFYYFIRRLVEAKNEDFYTMPDKDSECYLLINEIHKIIDTFERNGNNSSELGTLYLIREFSYILYYLLDEPEKLQIPINNIDIYRVSQDICKFTDISSRNFGSIFEETIDKYRFVLKYLCKNYDNRDKIIYRYKSNERDLFLPDMFYSNDFFSVSNRLKQISQIFCAQLLVSGFEIIANYYEIFISFYYLIYAVEPAIIRREAIGFDMEILREYYDLLSRYFRSYKSHNFEGSLGYLFESYEIGLRRMIDEREY